MPFDSTRGAQNILLTSDSTKAPQNILSSFDKPTVTVLPPIPPEGGGGPQRIVVNIEIVDRRAVQDTLRRSRPGTVAWVVFWLLVLIALAHAQPITYEHQQGPHGWHSETFRQGTVEDWRALGPHGEQRHCHSYVPGGAQGHPSDRVTTCE
jgi:hypothetical protein